MKNFICFVILLIFAAFVFFIGWTQIKVKPGTVGVVQSKTGGIDKKPVIPGKFSWHKEFLIPSNAKLNVFDVKPYNGTKTINASRGGGNDFMFTFQISLAYDPLIIVDLLEENKVSCQEDMEQYLDGAAAYLAQKAADYCITRFSKEPLFSPESVTISELTSAVAFYKTYPEFDINVLAITDYKLPYREEVIQ